MIRRRGLRRLGPWRRSSRVRVCGRQLLEDALVVVSVEVADLSMNFASALEAHSLTSEDQALWGIMCSPVRNQMPFLVAFHQPRCGSVDSASSGRPCSTRSKYFSWLDLGVAHLALSSAPSWSVDTERRVGRSPAASGCAAALLLDEDRAAPCTVWPQPSWELALAVLDHRCLDHQRFSTSSRASSAALMASRAARDGSADLGVAAVPAQVDVLEPAAGLVQGVEVGVVLADRAWAVGVV